MGEAHVWIVVGNGSGQKIGISLELLCQIPSICIVFFEAFFAPMSLSSLPVDVLFDICFCFVRPLSAPHPSEEAAPLSLVVFSSESGWFFPYYLYLPEFASVFASLSLPWLGRSSVFFSDSVCLVVCGIMNRRALQLLNGAN